MLKGFHLFQEMRECFINDTLLTIKTLHPIYSRRFPFLFFNSVSFQNLNSDFTDSALGSTDKSPLPYGNFQLRESTMQSILNNPKYGPRSELGTNMFTYLKFGLPRVLPPGKGEQVNHS